jgi:hypothetical protein
MRSNKYVEILIMFFMIIMISLFILLGLYYITPSNYLLENFDLLSNKIPQKKTQLIIEPYEELQFIWENKSLRIYENLVDGDNVSETKIDNNSEILIRVENKLKSESLYIKPSNILIIKNSDLVIMNPTSKPLKIIVDSYDQ